MKLPALTRTLICAALLCPLVPVPATADIVRHCKGYVGLRILSGVDRNGRNFTVNVFRGSSIIQLSGRGTCRGSAWANDCRRNARDAVIHCARGLWNARWQKRVPMEVCESADNGRPPHAGITSWTLHRNDVKRALEHAACCTVIPDARLLNFAVYLSVQGDTRCSYSADLEPFYRADCTQLRGQGLCAKRTG
jgi:hypothetical protein